MKKLLLAPFLLALCLNLIACGKKDSSNPGGPIASPPAPIVVDPPINSGNFANDCNAMGGSVLVVASQNVCQFTKNYTLNYRGIGNVVVGTGIMIYPYAHVYVNGSKTVIAYAGGYYMSKVNSNNVFVANSYGGNFGFSGNDSTDNYSIYTVQVTAAFNEAHQYVAF